MDKIESIIIPNIDEIGINDAIEYYEIKRYFDDGIRSKTWSDEEFIEYNKKSNTLFGLTMRFFNKLDDSSIVAQYSLVDGSYKSSFWRLFDKCKLYKKISNEVFDIIINNGATNAYDIFSHKNIVNKYGSNLRLFIINNPSLMDIVLRVYEQNYTESEKLYLPPEFSEKDIIDYIESYIDSEHPSINELELITLMKSDERFKISDEIRYKAKERQEKESEILFRNSFRFGQGISVAFSSDIENEKEINENGTDINITYNVNWLQDTLDYPSILNNFIYLFEFVDVPQMRCLHVAKRSDANILEHISRTESKRHYPVNHSFRLINGLASLQMAAYYEFLEKNNIRYEDVLEWFYTSYIQEEFHCSEMRVSFPSEKTSFSEKCSIICDAFETVLKQFDLYVKNKSINFELLKMSSGSKKIGDVSSLVKTKYIYGNEKDYDRLKYYMFSDQCMLSYVPRIRDDGRLYNSFYDLIKNETIFITDYSEADQRIIQYLKEYELILIDSEGRILPNNNTKIIILMDLNRNDYISKWHYPPESYPVINDWINKKILCSGDSLLSKQETAYYDYLLNRVEFVNGLDIRNKYKHGNQHVITDINEHKQNYMVLLRLFTILTIKINDDFCLFEQLNKYNADT